MRRIIIAVAALVFFAACKKDKYTTEPQISFKSISPNVASSDITSVFQDQAPKLTIEVTDAEGDIGFKQGKDTARIYLKNLITSSVDSFDFPDIQASAVKNLKADVTVNLFEALECSSSTPHTDTIFYEVYVRDFAKHKSNVIVTRDPVYFQCL